MDGITTHDTFFKLSARPAAELSEGQKLAIKKGQSFEVLGFRDAGDRHYQLTFSQNLGTQRRNTWYVYRDHISLNIPSDQPGARHISQAGLELIKGFEGFRPAAYLCPAGVWTIGFGFTQGVKPGQHISLVEATQRLSKELHRYERGVLALLKVEATQNQFDALVSLAFNIGLGAIAKSSVIKYHNRLEFDRAGDAFLLWNRGGGKVLSGLTRRRRDERALYLA